MASIELIGFDQFTGKISALKRDATKMCKAVVYPGAAILAEKIRAETEALPTITDAQARANFRSGTVNEALSESQKAGLVESLGISGIKKDRHGMVQTSVGFAGYNSIETDTWPNGQPNAMVARSLEKGLSFLKRNRFVERAVKAAREGAIEAMQEEADRQIEKIMQDNSGG